MSDKENQELVKMIALLPTFKGWCDESKARYMFELVLQHKLQNYVEIGAYGGQSIFPVAMAMRHQGSGHIIGMDPWEEAVAIEGMVEKANIDWWTNNSHLAEVHEHCQKRFEELGLAHIVTLVQTKAEDYVHNFPDESIDFLHIDGSHSEDPSYKDATMYLPKVKSGGWVCMDDIYWTEGGKLTTEGAVNHLLASCDVIDRVGTGLMLRKR